MTKFYLTTAIPYVNDKPHVGHALEFVQADVVKRYRALIGDETLLLSGGDENALKNVQAAEKEGLSAQELVDKNSKLFANLAEALNIKFDVFEKGSSQPHYSSSQKLWDLCEKAGDIYKNSYTGLYCVGCEAFYEPSELNENGECFEHPGKKLEEVTEENYFFRLSKYQDQILDLLEKDKLKITPDFRKTEVVNFVKGGLHDISISRSNERAKNWGVPVPGDDKQRMYVWFDALNIYQSGIGFGLDEAKYKKWWPADLHVIGKGIIKFHAVYWPAFLLSAGLSLPKQLFVHGYFTVDGQKMSKTIGNVIDPIELINEYGADALRYFFVAEIPPTADGDFSREKLKEVYNGQLANGLGNLIARVAKLAESLELDAGEPKKPLLDSEFRVLLEKFEFQQAIVYIWDKIRACDKKIEETRPWELVKTDPDKARGVVENLVRQIQEIQELLLPFLPETAEKIAKQFSGKIKAGEPLFPRKN